MLLKIYSIIEMMRSKAETRLREVRRRIDGREALTTPSMDVTSSCPWQTSTSNITAVGATPEITVEYLRFYFSGKAVSNRPS